MTTYAARLTRQPDADSIKRYADVNAELLDKSIVNWAENDTFFDQTYKVWATKIGGEVEGRPFYYTPKSRAIVLQPLKTQFSYEAKAHRNPVGDGEHATEWASLVERWMQATLFQLAALSLTPLWKALNRQQLLYGKAVLEAVRWVSQPEEEPPERNEDEDQDEFEGRLASWEWDRKHWFPFRAGVIHPSKFLADPWTKHPTEVVIRKVLKGWEIEQLVQKKIALKRALADTFTPDDPDKPNIVDEYFNKNWHAMKLKDGAMLFLERNRRGYVPYMQMYTGDGGERTNDEIADPKDLAVGIYDGNKDAIRTWDQQASTRHNMLMRKGWASLVTKANDPGAKEALGQAARGDTVLGIGPDDISVIRYPDVTNDLFTEVGVQEKGLIENTFPPNITGQKQPGVDTVGQELLLSRAGQRIFDGIALNQAEAATWTAENILKALDRYGNPITVRGVTLEPKHIQHMYAIRVEFPNPDLTLQAVEWQQAEKDNVRGIIPDEEYRRIRGIEDEEKMRTGLLRDSIRKHPSVQAAMARAEAELMGAPLNEQAGGGASQNGATPPAEGVGAAGPNGRVAPGGGSP